MRDLSLYVHVPFCTRRCPYCSFYHVRSTPELQSAFVEVLVEEIQAELGKRPAGTVLRTIYFGGGTPSVLEERSWRAIFRVLEPHLRTGRVREITCELNPEDVSLDVLQILAEGGVNRVSLGIQSMNPDAQRVLGRCDPARNRRAIQLVGDVFANVNFDVLVGIPGGAPDALEASMDELASCRPAHFSVYCLEPGEKLGAGSEGFFEGVDTDRSADEYLYVCDRLGRLGYRHYEVSNFALPGMESLHNLCYWEGGEYVGVGPAAHSYVDGMRYSNTASLRAYLNKGWLGTDKIRVYDERGPCAAETELIMLGLRTARGVPLRSLRCEERTVRDMVAEGVARIDGERIVLTDRGFLVMNEVLLRLMTWGNGGVARSGF